MPSPKCEMRSLRSPFYHLLPDTVSYCPISKMRLLNTSTLQFREFDTTQTPAFAILPNTWDKDEVTFDGMCGIQDTIKDRQGYQKVLNFCLKAKESGLEYGWVDTCCI